MNDVASTVELSLFLYFNFLFSVDMHNTRNRKDLAVRHSESTSEFVIIHSKLYGIPNLVFVSL